MRWQERIVFLEKCVAGRALWSLRRLACVRRWWLRLAEACAVRARWCARLAWWPLTWTQRWLGRALGIGGKGGGGGSGSAWGGGAGGIASGCWLWDRDPRGACCAPSGDASNPKVSDAQARTKIRCM